MDIYNAIWAEVSDSVFQTLFNNVEYRNLQTEHETCSEEFFDTLRSDQKKRILELESGNNLLFALEQDAVFAYGFRLGARFMLDIITDKDVQ